MITGQDIHQSVIDTFGGDEFETWGTADDASKALCGKLAEMLTERFIQPLQAQIVQLKAGIQSLRDMDRHIIDEQDAHIRDARQLAMDWRQLVEDYEALRPVSPISAYEAWDKRRVALNERTLQMMREAGL